LARPLNLVSSSEADDVPSGAEREVVVEESRGFRA
jgi:hypothetical protein